MHASPFKVWVNFLGLPKEVARNLVTCNRNSSSHCAEGPKSKIKVSTELVSSEA